MPRFAPYFGVVAALLVGVAALGVVEHSADSSISRPSASASSTALAAVPGIEFPPTASTSASAEVASTTKTRATQSKPVPRVPPVTAALPVPAAVTSIPPQPSSTTESSGNPGLDTAASALRSALVNIICYAPAGSGFNSISGSGVIIDPKGIILTNAHVAQYFLLADKGVSCGIRADSPAANAYNASLVFISPAWISANAGVLTEAAPTGTGQYDFALLAITRSVTSSALPTTFPFMPLALDPPTPDTPIVIASYGAQFLQSAQIQSALFPTVVFGSIKSVYTFGTNTIDVLALGGSAAAQEGSSGGGIADASGSLVGTITTSTVDGATATRSLDAISASYIRGDFASETGEPLDLLLAEPINLAIEDFIPEISGLEATLIKTVQ